jgi:hypothetical protein
MRFDDGEDLQGRKWFHHERCGLPASEVEIHGELTIAKAILCPKHHAQAEALAFVSERGWPLGKVKKDENGNPVCEQTRAKPAILFGDE